MDTIYQNLGAGLAVYKKSTSRFWYAYMQVKTASGRLKRKDKSLKTTDLNDAIRLAVREQIKHEVATEMGVSLVEDRLTFKQVANDFLDNLFQNEQGKGDFKVKHKGKIKFFRELIKRTFDFTNHLIDSIGDKPIADIKTKDLSLAVRKEEDKEELAKSTVSARLSVINKIFNFALQEDYLKPHEVPALPDIETRKREVRKAFTDEQIEQINTIMKDLIRTGSKNKKSEENRRLLYYYFNINLHLGARVGEELVFNTFKDIEKHTQDGKPIYTIHIYNGKTQNYSMSRKMVIKLDALMYLSQLVFSKFNCTIDEAITKHRNELIFARLSDNQVPTFVALWDDIRDRAIEQGIIFEDDKKLLTLYSTRHYYATHMLLNSVAKNKISLHELARQMGTSEKMIEHNYSHVNALMVADKFIQTTDQRLEALYNASISYDDIYDLIHFRKTGQIRLQRNEDIDSSAERLRINAKRIEKKYKVDLDNTEQVNQLIEKLKNQPEPVKPQPIITQPKIENLPKKVDPVVEAPKPVSVKEEPKKEQIKISEKRKDEIKIIENHVKVEIASQSNDDKIKIKLEAINKLSVKFLKEPLNGNFSQLASLMEILHKKKNTEGIDTIKQTLYVFELQKQDKQKQLFEELVALRHPILLLTKDITPLEVFFKSRYRCFAEIKELEQKYKFKITDRTSAKTALNEVEFREKKAVNQYIFHWVEYEKILTLLKPLKEHTLFLCARYKVPLADIPLVISRLPQGKQVELSILKNYLLLADIEQGYIDALSFTKDEKINLFLT